MLRIHVMRNFKSTVQLLPFFLVGLAGCGSSAHTDTNGSKGGTAETTSGNKPQSENPSQSAQGDGTADSASGSGLSNGGAGTRWHSDPDGDGVPTSKDNCPDIWNADQK